MANDIEAFTIALANMDERPAAGFVANNDREPDANVDVNPCRHSH
jgi:hypothetical protein